VSSEGPARPTSAEVANVQRIAEQLTIGLNQHRVPGNENPVEQQNPSDAVWRYVSLLGLFNCHIFCVHFIHHNILNY
jgi:autocrine motility factor receptor